MQVSVTIICTKGANYLLAEPQKLEQLNPKELMLYATAQCAGKTLSRILEKEKVEPKKVELCMSGKLDTAELLGQSRFGCFNIRFNIECNSIDEQQKVSHAVNLTLEKYCGNLAMLRAIAPLSHEVEIVSTQKEVYQL